MCSLTGPFISQSSLLLPTQSQLSMAAPPPPPPALPKPVPPLLLQLPGRLGNPDLEPRSDPRTEVKHTRLMSIGIP